MRFHKIVLILVLVLFVILPTVNGQVSMSNEEGITYTNTTKTDCNDKGTCKLTLYSGIRFVEEDDEWIPIAEAKSLKDYYDIVYLENDPSLKINIIDFNYTNIELELTVDNTQLAKDIPIELYRIDKDLNKETDEITEVKNSSFLDTTYFTELSSKNTINVDYRWGDIIKFGSDSTIIVLQDVNTENLDDSWIDEENNSDNFGGDDDMFAGNEYYAHHLLIKFDLTQIPAGQVIDNADLNLWAISNTLDNDTEGWDLNLHHIYQSFEWHDYNITWDTMPASGTDYNATPENGEGLYCFGGAGEPDGNQFWSATEMVSNAYISGDVNISIFVFMSNIFGSPATDTMRFKTKEALTQRPMLTIEYSDAPNSTPTTILQAPNGNQYVGGTDVNISFSVIDADLASASAGDLLADIYYSADSNEFTTSIAADVELTIACDDTDFTDATNCYFNWNTDGNSIVDGNWVIDINIHDASDTNGIDSSDATFFLDNSIPDIYIWQPLVNEIDSNTLVTFDVNENSLVTNVAVEINAQTSGDFVFATHCALFDINYHCSYVETGFVPNFDNTLSLIGTNTIGDTNQSDLNFVYNRTPAITIQAPAGNQYLGGDDLNISFRVTDSDLNGEFLDGLFVTLAFSPASGAFTNTIVAKLDLFTADCDSNVFNGGVNCTYEWDANAVTDGNYFLDGNVFDRYDFNAQGSGAASFFMDNSAPDIFINRPLQGSTVSARQIEFNVMENGRVSTISTLINGAASTVFSQGTHCTLVDINYTCAYVENAVTAGDNNITIRALNTGGGNDQNEFSHTFVFNDPDTGGAGGGGGIVLPPPSPEKRFEVVSIPETVSASRGIGTEFRITVKNISNEELSNFEIRFNEEIAPLINTISAPEVIGAGEMLDFVYRITPEEDSESQSLVAFFFDGSFADSQEISVLVIDNPLLFAIAGLNAPAFNFGESIINWNILLFVIVVFAFMAFINPLPKQLISVKIITLVVLGLLLISAVAGA